MTNDKEIQNVSIEYLFTKDEKPLFKYKINLDEKTNLVSNESDELPPDWTLLQNHKCPHCPLDEATTKYCPIAKNIFYLVEDFKNEFSYESTNVIVNTQERSYSKDTSMQIGLQSLLGVVMATSGCPKLNFLKPMARFHLPFSSFEETMVRSISMYLLRQYFAHQNNIKPDYELEGLEKAYDEVNLVNKSLFQRTRSISKKDANLNAILILDTFTVLLNSELERNLESISSFFE
ncbi:MAG: hypothetical protein HOO06_10740 [Bdellovibrionaceae bacterium]|nr:hypothetical protein [Pseudobdellovibrionaceae bacterium]